MKKHAFIVSSLIICLSAFGQVFEENFEVWPLENWAFYALKDTHIQWSSYTGAQEGSYAAYHYFYGSDTSDNWMVTPQLVSLPASSFLYFYERNEAMSIYEYSGVLISTGSGDPSDGEFIELYESSSSIPGYTLKSIDLSAYAGENVYLAFHYLGMNGHMWYIDNLHVIQTFANDASIDIISDSVLVNDSLMVQVQLTNLGTSVLSSNKEIYISVDGIAADTLYSTQDLNQFASEEIIFSVDKPAGLYTVGVETEDDDNNSNNTSEINVRLFGETYMVQTFETVLSVNWLSNYLNRFSTLHNNGYYCAGKSSGNTQGTLTTMDLNINAGDIVGFYALGNNEDERICLQYWDKGDDTWKNIQDTVHVTSGWNYYSFDLSSVAGMQTQLRVVLMNLNSSNYPFIDNLMVPGFFQTYPEIVTGTSPNNGAINISTSTSYINWSQNLNGAYINGYKVFMGTDGEGVATPTDLYNGDTATGNYFVIGEQLEYSTTYYLQIVPFNNFGDALDCPVYHFRTLEKTYLDAPFVLDFNDELKPAGWYDYFFSFSLGSAPSYLSTNYFLPDRYMNRSDSSYAIRINLYSEMHILSILPNIVLGDPAHHDFIEFDMAMTHYNGNTPDTLDLDDTLALVVSTDGDWLKENILYQITHEDKLGYGRHVKIDINDFSDTIQLAFYATSQTAMEDIDIFIDNFSISQIPENASLSWIKLYNIMLGGFDPGILNYTIYMPRGYTIPPTVSAGPVDPLAQVIVTQADGVPGTATIQVTPQNPDFTKTYTIHFDKTTDINYSALQSFELYPNPVVDEMHFNRVVDYARVMDITGTTVLTDTYTDGINLGMLKSGCYMVEISLEGEKAVYKIIKE